MNNFEKFVKELKRALPQGSDLRSYPKRREIHVFTRDKVGFVLIDSYDYPTAFGADVTLYRHGREVKSYSLPAMRSVQTFTKSAKRVAVGATWVQS